MGRNAKSASSMLGIVGLYMFYIAYQLYQGMQSGTDQLAPALSIAAIVFFVLAGVGLILFGLKVYNNAVKA